MRIQGYLALVSTRDEAVPVGDTIPAALVSRGADFDLGLPDGSRVAEFVTADAGLHRVVFFREEDGVALFGMDWFQGTRGGSYTVTFPESGPVWHLTQ